MTCTKTEPKNDTFFNCWTKTKELSKKELSNIAPASAKSFQTQKSSLLTNKTIKLNWQKGVKSKQKHTCDHLLAFEGGVIGAWLPISEFISDRLLPVLNEFWYTDCLATILIHFFLQRVSINISLVNFSSKKLCDCAKQ